MNKIDEATMETLIEKTGKRVLIQTQGREEAGTLSNVKTRSITIISEMGAKTTISFKKIGEIKLSGIYPEVLYEN